MRTEKDKLREMFFALARHTEASGSDLTHLREVSGGHVNQAGVRKDIVLTWGQTKQTLTLPRVHVNSTETWQRSVSLPCKVCGEVEEEEGEEVHRQIDSDSGGGKLEELSPLFTKLGLPCPFHQEIPEPLLSALTGGVTEPAGVLV